MTSSLRQMTSHKSTTYQKKEVSGPFLCSALAFHGDPAPGEVLTSVTHSLTHSLPHPLITQSLTHREVNIILLITPHAHISSPLTCDVNCLHLFEYACMHVCLYACMQVITSTVSAPPPSCCPTLSAPPMPPMPLSPRKQTPLALRPRPQ